MDELHQLISHYEKLNDEILELSYLQGFLESINQNSNGLLVDLCDINCLWVCNNTSFKFDPNLWELTVEVIDKKQNEFLNQTIATSIDLRNNASANTGFSISDSTTVQFKCNCFEEVRIQFNSMAFSSFCIKVILKTKYFELLIFSEFIDEMDTQISPINYIPKSTCLKRALLPIGGICMKDILRPITEFNSRVIKSNHRAIGLFGEQRWELVIENDKLIVSAESAIFDILLGCIKRRILHLR